MSLRTSFDLKADMLQMQTLSLVFFFGALRINSVSDLVHFPL